MVTQTLPLRPGEVAEGSRKTRAFAVGIPDLQKARLDGQVLNLRIPGGCHWPGRVATPSSLAEYLFPPSIVFRCWEPSQWGQGKGMGGRKMAAQLC